MGQPTPGQEIGVTGAGQQFGPARGEYHDTKRWAMTVSKATAREIVIDPPPTDRQRKPGEPAFLRASDRTHSQFLASLLTIYHSIPLAREALLLPNFQQLTYGYDSQWWSGHQIEAPRVISLDSAGTLHNRDDLLIETQRLMAFLDNTNRAYASIDALVGLPNYLGKEAESLLNRFLQAWNEGAMIRSRDDPLTQVFSSHGIRSDEYNSMDKYFFCLEPMVDPEVDQTFTDILDNIIWSDQQSEQPLSDVWIDEIGDIMTLRLSDPQRKRGKLGVEIPAVWYPDRYMEHFRDASRDMRTRRRHILNMIRRLEHSKKNVLSCTAAGRQGMLDIRRVLSDAAERTPLLANKPPQGMAIDTMTSPPPSNAEVIDCVKALQDLVASIDKKIAGLEHESEKLRVELEKTTAELTVFDPDQSTSPFHRYTLRGVCTKQHIAYVLRSSAERSKDLEGKISPSSQWQWWRISLETEEPKHKISTVHGPNPKPPQSSEQASSLNASGPFSTWQPTTSNNGQSSLEQDGNVTTYEIRKVSEQDVLKAAREEDDSITLVYASDKAISFQASALSGPLQMFVKADNRVFDNELRGITQSQGLYGSHNGEEMAQLHFSSLDGMQDVQLAEDSDETMNGDRVISTPALVALPARREADGQPSPKRAKGEGEPPPYHERSRNGPEMQERSVGMSILGTGNPNQIGQYADKAIAEVRDDELSDETIA